MALTASVIGATAGSVIPGVGTVIGAAAGSALDFVTTLFGAKSSSDVSNNNFIDGLVKYSQQVGFQGFTHDDVLHLMPGGWGSNYTQAAQDFQGYLNQWKLRTGNIVPTTNFGQGAGVWGGGYQPGHPIYYIAPTNLISTPPIGSIGTINTSPTSTSGIIGASGISVQNSSLFSNPLMLIIIIGLVVTFALGGFKGLIK
jgi:hypothetical protein